MSGDTYRISVEVPAALPQHVRDRLLLEIADVVYAWTPAERDWNPFMHAYVVVDEEDDDE